MRRIIGAVFAGVVLAVSVASPASATAAPSTVVFHSQRAFKNVAEPGDMLVVFHGEIDYGGSYPTDLASDTFTFRMLDTDGTTLLTSRTPYVFGPFATNGYGDLVGALYFTASTAPVWSGGYVLSILGLPVYFSSPQPEARHTLSPTDYSVVETQGENRADLYIYIMQVCEQLHSVYPEITFTSYGENGDVLSVYGDAFFKAVIPGLQAMCPNLFLIQSYVPPTMATDNYSMAGGNPYSTRLAGKDIMRGLDRTGELLGGLGGKFLAALGAFAVCVIICIVTQRKWGDIFSGIGASALVITCAALLIGDMMYGLLMIAGLIAGIGIAFVLHLKRA